MLKLVVCIIVLAAVCCAQEHLTCLRTDGVFNQQSLQTSQRALQGPPGKRGPKGQMGSRGRPGQKGESGILDDRQINFLRDQYNVLSQKVEVLKQQSRENQQQELMNTLFQEVEALKNQSRKIQQFIDRFSKGLDNDPDSPLDIAPDSYTYQLTPGTQTWQKSQEVCQNLGGSLAVHGVRTLENRRKLIQNLTINKNFWIGASDIASEGNWVWVNGDRANTSELIWGSERPSNGGDCLRVSGNPIYSDTGLAYDEPCMWYYQGLCEKQM